MRFQKTREMSKRLVVRSIVLLVFIIAAFVGMEYLVQQGHTRASDINQRFPELLIMLRAVALYVWAEVSVFWIRTTLESNTDVQQSANIATGNDGEHTSDRKAAAFVYLVHTIKWAIRLWFIFKIADVV